MPLSSQLSAYIREILSDVKENKRNEPEILKIEPLLKVQQERSSIPSESEFLIEMIKSREGYHIFFFLLKEDLYMKEWQHCLPIE